MARAALALKSGDIHVSAGHLDGLDADDAAAFVDEHAEEILAEVSRDAVRQRGEGFGVLDVESGEVVGWTVWAQWQPNHSGNPNDPIMEVA
jgi:hypothetical protein